MHRAPAWRVTFHKAVGQTGKAIFLGSSVDEKPGVITVTSSSAHRATFLHNTLKMCPDVIWSNYFCEKLE
ncbi:hypothetical protein EYF80_006929 [Liparis tanakae]|uniref:Uncharacterized protein n=1 Tax=Liparis tanakae TaxID=230148 RepID=A0A4Z2J098_9TELE|nr:hypothetical protein EYF80_006929 [Liparis tanakae]